MHDSKTKKSNFKAVMNQVLSTTETVLPTGQTHLQSHVMLNVQRQVSCISMIKYTGSPHQRC